VFNSADRRALEKLFRKVTKDKYMEGISAIYEKNVAAVKVIQDISSWFRIKSGVKQGCVLYPFMRIILMDFVLRSRGKVMGKHRIKWEEKLS